MGCRRIINDRVNSCEEPRNCFWNSTSRVSVRLFAGGNLIWRVTRHNRLARNVHGRCAACAPGLYIRRNVEESPSWEQMERKPGQFWETLKVHWPLFIFVILLMTAQLLQPRDSGSLPIALFERSAQVFRRHGRNNRGRLQHWSHFGRANIRLDLTTNRPQMGNHSSRYSNPADHSDLGIFEIAVPARIRRIFDPILCSGSVGHRSRAFE
jgi:hypothetical protein